LNPPEEEPTETFPFQVQRKGEYPEAWKGDPYNPDPYNPNPYV